VEDGQGKVGGRASSGVKSELLEILTKLRILKIRIYGLELSPPSRDGWAAHHQRILRFWKSKSQAQVLFIERYLVSENELNDDRGPSCLWPH
jgi:hypothetical protein